MGLYVSGINSFGFSRPIAISRSIDPRGVNLGRAEGLRQSSSRTLWIYRCSYRL